MGSSVRFITLRQKVNAIWKLRENVSPIDVGNGFFVVRFWHKEDYDKVLSGRLWSILGHFLTLQKWQLDFDANDEREVTTRVWIRFPSIPLPMYDKDCLVHLGEKIGRDVRINPVTVESARGRYAQISVEVDLAKPLPSHVWVECHIFNVEYESLYTICFTCGKYRHRVESYLESRPPTTTSTGNKPPLNGRETGVKQKARPVTKGKQKERGEWMVIPKKTWGRSSPLSGQSKKDNVGLAASGENGGTTRLNKGKGKVQPEQQRDYIGTGSHFALLGQDTIVDLEPNHADNEDTPKANGPMPLNPPLRPAPDNQIKQNTNIINKPNKLTINTNKIPLIGLGRTFQITD